MTEKKISSRDNFCLDILKGLAVYFDSAFVADIYETACRYPHLKLGHALNRNQTTSKKWLIESLHGALGRQNLGTIYILGGWYGVLAAMLLHDARFDVERIISIDIDPACEDVARSLNCAHGDRFAAITADMNGLSYDGDDLGAAGVVSPDLIINTSCEHLEKFGDWYGTVPAGRLLVLQSNNYYGVDGHVGCVDDLTGFKRQAPMAEVIFEGERAMEKYTRFMLIGRK